LVLVGAELAVTDEQGYAFFQILVTAKRTEKH
jgi:hypothetical protein